MSLLVWLPLNGNLQNNGNSSNLTFSGTPTWNNNGKIGQCFSCNSGRLSTTIPELEGIEEWSICFWAKLDSSATYINYKHLFDLKSTLNDGTTYNINIEFRDQNRVGKLNFHVGKEASVGSNTDIYKSTGDDLCSSDKWAHWAIVKDSTQLKRYVNGIFYGSWNCNTFESAPAKLSTNFYLGNTDCPAWLNDFRIYDHVLSIKEIEEIAKGLVLHYKLDDQIGQKNLHKNSFLLDANWTVNQGTISNGIATITPTTNGDRRIYQMPANGDWTWQANTVYTASIEARSSNGAKLQFSPYGGNTSTSSAINLTTEWKRYSYTFTTGASPTTGSMTYMVNQYENITLELRKPKLELGSILTEWIPNPVDKEYTQIGLNSNIVYDNSGYNNNGTIIGTLNYLSDTPRYSISTQINGSKINCTSSLVNIADPIFTVALWFKLYSDITYTSYQDLINFASTSYSNQPFRLEICGNPVGSDIYWFRGPSGNTGGFKINNSALSFNTWYYTVLVSEGNKQYSFYLNGIKQGVYNGSANTWIPTGNVYIGDTITGKIDMSDFRIYTTALTESQILELYNTSATVDKSANIYTREVIE